MKRTTNSLISGLLEIESEQLSQDATDADDNLRARIAERSDHLFDAQREKIYRRTDRLFAGLMIFQWLAGIVAALVLSPSTWQGANSEIHKHVWAAIFLGGAIICFPLFLVVTRPGTVLTRHVIAAGQMLNSALLIHLTGGRIETHFHVFGSLAFLAFYCDWRVLITASAIVAVDHFVRGIYWPQSVFGVLTASPWRWIEHACWVIFEDFFLIIACLRNVVDIRNMAGKQAVLETVKERIERKVTERTAELAAKNYELDHKNDELAEKIEQLKASQAETARKNEELARKNEELIASQQRADRIFSALAAALPGTVLDGKYHLDTKIGTGGYGVIYRATHLSLNRSVAVKLFRPAAGNDSADALERFRMEGVSACRVNHPNAVSVLDSGISADGIPYIVMELLEGHSLVDDLRTLKKLSVQRSCEIAIAVCKALAEAHRVGIIHRDIKPDNIFLHQGADGEVIKVVDFGIAKLMDQDGSGNHLMTTDGIIGTPTYMAPERVSKKGYDGKSDVYSLGIMLYEMLTGRVPFDPFDWGVVEVMIMHIKEEPLPLRDIDPEIPAALEAIVLRTLSKEPEKRPTPQELAIELAEVSGLPLTGMLGESGTFRALSLESLKVN